MVHINILGVSVAALAASAVIGVAHGKTVSLSPLGGSGAAVSADEGDIVKVKGRGVGTTRAEALKDAYRDAVERAVGLYVDADIVAENDQLVKDQILTQSNAYITDYQELGMEKIAGGLVQLRILATVRKRALTTKLSGVMPTQTAALNSAGLQNVHAQLVTKEKRAGDAAALLKNALDGINPMKSLMVANIRPETQKIVAADDNSGDYSMRGRGARGGRGSSATADSSNSSVTLRYLFEVRLDREKYFSEFVPHLKKVLDQISLTPPKEIRLTELVWDPNATTHLVHLQEFLNGNISNQFDFDSDRSGGSGRRLFTRNSHVPVFFDPAHCYSISWNGYNWAWLLGYDYEHRLKSGDAFSGKRVALGYEDFDERYRKDKVYFALITSLNASCSNGKVTMYELDKSVVTVLNAWRRELIEKDTGDLAQKTTDYNIVFLDKNGEEIDVYPWQIENGLLMNIKLGVIPGAGMVYCAPFVGCFGECLIQWRDFVLEKDALAKIASVKIELEDADPEPASATPGASAGGYTK